MMASMGSVVGEKITRAFEYAQEHFPVHAGCAIEVMEKDKAEDLIALFKEIEELESEYK